MEKQWFNTIDLDFADKLSVARVETKILRLQCCRGIIVKPSAEKGYHLLIFCKYKCDLCRLLFDDAERFDKDLIRPNRRRDVLFSTYKYYPASASLSRLAVKPVGTRTSLQTLRPLSPSERKYLAAHPEAVVVE